MQNVHNVIKEDGNGYSGDWSKSEKRCMVSIERVDVTDINFTQDVKFSRLGGI